MIISESPQLKLIIKRNGLAHWLMLGLGTGIANGVLVQDSLWLQDISCGVPNEAEWPMLTFTIPNLCFCLDRFVTTN